MERKPRHPEHRFARGGAATDPMSKVHFLIALHDHQPVGNFDAVFERACNDAYKPFLDELQRHPRIRMALHYSGSLLEWIERHRPDIVGQIREMVRTGQLEIMGGGYYEPILTMLSERDRIGQVRSYKEHLEELFQTPVRGLWLTERVWEQCLTRSLVDAGVDYTIVDDTHFKYAGLKDEQLTGYFVTEDEGRLLRVFAGSEKLRYHIPFGDPWKTTEYLGQVNSRGTDALVVYADDGEKFGVWPETNTHVYVNGWLRRFFEEIERNLHWIDFITFSEALDRFPPAAKIYLPDASYREMTEWALPAGTLVDYEETVKELERHHLYDRAKLFMRGGFWRSFKVKYHEANMMYAKSMHVSRKVQAIQDPDAARRARTELYRGQCNCAYWHGVFGGLYLPHLRHAIYEHLIEAEKIADSLRGPGTLDADVVDYDMDGHPEICLANDFVAAVVKPDRGGHLAEFDSRRKNANLLGGLSRRFEAYHRNITNPPPPAAGGEVKSIHHIVASKEKDLDKLLHYDWYIREGFVDHFILPDVTLVQMMECRFIERSDHVQGGFNHALVRVPHGVEVRLERDGAVWIGSRPCRVRMEKTYALDAVTPGIECRYAIISDEPLDVVFAPECNLAFPGKEREFWSYRLKDGLEAGELEGQHAFEQQAEAGVTDRLRKQNVIIAYSRPADLWMFPIRTVSQSESGFEHVFQSCAIVARWPLHLEAGNPWTVTVTQSVIDI